MDKVWIVTQHTYGADGTKKTSVVLTATSPVKARDFILVTKRYKVVTSHVSHPSSTKFHIDHYRIHEMPVDTEMDNFNWPGDQIVDDMQQLRSIAARWEREHNEWMLSQQPFTPDFAPVAATSGSATPPRRTTSSSTSSPTHPFMGVLTRSPPLSGGRGGGLLSGMVAGLARQRLDFNNMT